MIRTVWVYKENNGTSFEKKNYWALRNKISTRKPSKSRKFWCSKKEFCNSNSKINNYVTLSNFYITNTRSKTVKTIRNLFQISRNSTNYKWKQHFEPFYRSHFNANPVLYATLTNKLQFRRIWTVSREIFFQFLGKN